MTFASSRGDLGRASTTLPAVWGGHGEVVQGQQGVVGGNRLLPEHIQGRAAVDLLCSAATKASLSSTPAGRC